MFSAILERSAPLGDIFGTIVFHFDNDEFPEIETRVIGRKSGAIRIIPSRLFVGDKDRVVLRKSDVLLRSTDHKPFGILNIVSPRGVVVTMDRPNDEMHCTQYQLTVRVSGVWIPKHHVAFVTIRTTRGDHPVVQIPIVWNVL